MSYIVDKIVLKPGEKLFSEGEMGDCAYIIEEGGLEISRTIDGREVPITTIPTGEIVGEMALIDNAPRSATARATMPTVLLVVHRAAFDIRMENADPVIRKLLQRFVSIIRNVTTENVRLAKETRG